MSATFRTLVVTSSTARRELLARLTEGSDLVVEEIAEPEAVIASVALRAPDLILIDADADPAALAQVCGVLKANPATVLLPLLAVARSPRARLGAFEAGVDDCLMQSVHREEFLMRARALLRASAVRRRLAAEQLADEIQHREDIRATFRRYISPKLADQILANPQLRQAAFHGAKQRTHAAILFADMRGFTGLSERLPAPQVVELLNEFFALLTGIVFEYDGTIFNMAGDSLLVGFGVPVEQSDETVRAILAARAMLQQFSILAEQWTRQHGVETGLGIGINAGEVVAGNIGSAAYMNYTIIGDAVNVASRLGQRARAGEMLFSNTVKHMLDQRAMDVGAIALPSFVLRGRSAPIDIFCVPSAVRIDVSQH